MHGTLISPEDQAAAAARVAERRAARRNATLADALRDAAVRTQQIAARSHQWVTEPVVDLPAVRVWHQMMSANEYAVARAAYDVYTAAS